MREAEAESDELFETANLFPGTTGLAMTVWVSPRGNARHDARVKVNMTHGDQMNSPTPRSSAFARPRMSLPAICFRMTRGWCSNGYR